MSLLIEFGEIVLNITCKSDHKANLYFTCATILTSDITAAHGDVWNCESSIFDNISDNILV